MKIIITFTVISLASCTTVKTKTTITAPDGTVTITESETTTPDKTSINAIAGTAQSFSPRPVVKYSK